MKGRITIKQVNSAVDELNKAVDAKYALLKTSKSRMTEPVRRAIQQYKEQEKKETKGMWVCVGVWVYVWKYCFVQCLFFATK